MKDNIAPAGRIWVCGACGKTAPDKYRGERGWDESCMLNAVLCFSEKQVFDGFPQWVAVPKEDTPAVTPGDGSGA
jgi:hypothetical protein